MAFLDLKSSYEDSYYKRLGCAPSCDFQVLQTGAITASHLLLKTRYTMLQCQSELL